MRNLSDINNSDRSITNRAANNLLCPFKAKFLYLYRLPYFLHALRIKSMTNSKQI